MIKVLEQAIEKIRTLPEERQRLAAELLEQLITARDEEIYQLSEAEERAIDEALAELDRGEAASETEVRAVFEKYRA